MEQTKILLIGAGGFLGFRVARYWTGRDLDLSSPDEINRQFDLHRPDQVVLTAALSNTGY